MYSAYGQKPTYGQSSLYGVKSAAYQGPKSPYTVANRSVYGYGGYTAAKPTGYGYTAVSKPAAPVKTSYGYTAAKPAAPVRPSYTPSKPTAPVKPTNYAGYAQQPVK